MRGPLSPHSNATNRERFIEINVVVLRPAALLLLFDCHRNEVAGMSDEPTCLLVERMLIACSDSLDTVGHQLHVRKSRGNSATFCFCFSC